MHVSANISLRHILLFFYFIALKQKVPTQKGGLASVSHYCCCLGSFLLYGIVVHLGQLHIDDEESLFFKCSYSESKRFVNCFSPFITSRKDHVRAITSLNMGVR